MKPGGLLLALLGVASCGPRQLSVTMHAQNNSGQSGYATLTDLGAQTHVLIVIHKSDVPEEQPVHFHPGRCGEIGGKFIPTGGLGLPNIGPIDRMDKVATAENPAPASDGGIVWTQATLDVKFKDVTGGDFVLNVHDSRDFALYVSCGNIN
jgi:hypothetical protein